MCRGDLDVLMRQRRGKKKEEGEEEEEEEEEGKEEEDKEGRTHEGHTYPWPIFSIFVYFLVGSPILTICPVGSRWKGIMHEGGPTGD